MRVRRMILVVVVIAGGWGCATLSGAGAATRRGRIAHRRWIALNQVELPSVNNGRGGLANVDGHGQQAAMADVPDTNQVLSRPGPRNNPPDIDPHLASSAGVTDIEVVHPVPVDEVRPWLASMATTFLNESRRGIRALRRGVPA